MIKLDDIYSALIEAVKHSPLFDGIRINTFARIRNLGDLNAENLALAPHLADNVYYSRGVGVMPPLCALFELSSTINSPFARSSERNTVIELAVLIPNPKKVQSEDIESLCNQLHWWDLYRLTDEMVTYLIQYLNQLSLVTIDGVEQWRHTGILDTLGLTYVVDTRETNQYQQQLRRVNTVSEGQYYDDISGMYCGAAHQITLPIEYCRTDANFQLEIC